MRKFELSIHCYTGVPSYCATNKPVDDVTRTLKDLGYQSLSVDLRDSPGKFGRIWKYAVNMFKAIRTIRRENESEVLIQYPNHAPGHNKVLSLFMRFVKKHAKCTLLIHDIESLRYDRVINEDDAECLRQADRIIVHSCQMKQHLLKNGVNVPMTELFLFDYYITAENRHNASNTPYTIVYAGNLSKCTFLNKVGSSLAPYKLLLYGMETKLSDNPGIEYKGKFLPDNVEDIQGDWGLVWDGDSINGCTGAVGNYLKYNSPHKVSLYLSSGKPIIIWSQCALASYIKEYGLGLTVDSLDEIPQALQNIDVEQYHQYKKNVSFVAKELHRGTYLKRALL